MIEMSIGIIPALGRYPLSSVDFHSATRALQVITAACKLWQSAQEVNVLHPRC